ncbi:EAL domain-containing protein [Jeongeupia wiesaeckerbachi]|uniref:putative bifunctional diguanylate cyclase/phosphodiesterase n=1 Tax=Jeongeupia wiesaeckerbachi TaxID=3051218 RepID=UPI003D8087D8
MRSLRGRLLTACAVIQLVVLVMVMANTSRIWHDTVRQALGVRINALSQLFNATLAQPLARNAADAVQVIDSLQSVDGIRYLVLRRPDGTVIAARGWPAGTPLPEVDVLDAEHPLGAQVHAVASIGVGDRPLGELRYGVSTQPWYSLIGTLSVQNAIILAVGLISTLVLMVWLIVWLTRALNRLIDSAADPLHFSPLPVPLGGDELSLLTRRFNDMGEAIRERLHELADARRRGEANLALADTERARLTALLSAMRFGVLFVDNEQRIVFHNPAFCALWGVPATGLTGRPVDEVLQQAANRPPMVDLPAHYRGDLPSGHDRVDFGELTMNDGRIITQQGYGVAERDGSANGRVWLYEDVTQARQLAERMVNLAERDALTGLYNRHRFQEEIERTVLDAERRNGTTALLYFDLDEFKYVNDTFGHASGDELLKTIAREVGTQVRRHELLARLGGDEFAILLPDCTVFEVGKLADRLVSRIAQLQFSTDGHVLRPSTSIGVALYPQHANNAAELVAHADAAMYQAKAAGKSTWRMYRADSDTSRLAFTRLSWKERIVNALETDGFELHFQGIYRTTDRELVHLEALVRMKDASGALIMPGSFIPHAEKTGKIVDIDRWVIKRTIELLAARPGMPSVAINVSGRSFDEPELPDFIGRLLRLHCVEPTRLLVELTETAAVSDIGEAQRFIDALRATGCTVCLDDFGNGFASFAYLKQLKADILKIDGLFIRDLPNDTDSQVFVRGMVSMAHDMGKTTIAEFVENEAIYQMLLEMGVDLVQGYYLDLPNREHPGLCRGLEAAKENDDVSQSE